MTEAHPSTVIIVVGWKSSSCIGVAIINPSIGMTLALPLKGHAPNEEVVVLLPGTVGCPLGNDVYAVESTMGIMPNRWTENLILMLSDWPTEYSGMPKDQ